MRAGVKEKVIVEMMESGNFDGGNFKGFSFLFHFEGTLVLMDSLRGEIRNLPLNSIQSVN